MMNKDRRHDIDIFSAADRRGIGMLDARDSRGNKNAYVDLLQKLAIEDCYSFSGNETILEYGCGTGRISHWLGDRSARVIAADPEMRLLKIASEKSRHSNVLYVQIEESGFPFAKSAFDVITCIGLFRLVTKSEIHSILSGIKQTLKPGGHLICIDKVYNKKRPEHYTLDEYAEFFSAHGLTKRSVVPIRKGHWIPLYLVFIGFVPRSWFSHLARYELKKRPRQRASSWDYYQYLFHYKIE
ncbi:MAG: methyltransferase domain-containing protein [Candidatus Latescibacteria bacterium]|nr:methyltransferase domain-containing protein [Candidatus Latescibacterota bacterium]NIM21778.1 methyltransferase domain-containing protein [Candidatus Latescibacterota bacterium]NIM65916.1 methyltransferase domain-containing protein [Candidatus Latescibacterota bacterium]NIO02661.1 methyltransferase domain-containing protein [Candidatus Latescibacterota bacterium]NIO29642.1 methyltransferase domain-containing protein [Candidatus Latescibacterota bacterium]